MQEQRHEHHSVSPLTDAEVTAVRDVLDRDAKARWAWRMARMSAVWIAAVIGGLIFVVDGAKRLVRALLE